MNGETKHIEDDNDAMEQHLFLCFVCGKDNDSQQELITHYESAHINEPVTEDVVYSVDDDDSEQDPLAVDPIPESVVDLTLPEWVHRCVFCGFASTSKDEVLFHMNVHIETAPLTCKDCAVVLSEKHFNGSNRTLDLLHGCVHCSFKTKYHQKLKDHCLTHHSVTPILSFDRKSDTLGKKQLTNESVTYQHPEESNHSFPVEPLIPLTVTNAKSNDETLSDQTPRKDSVVQTKRKTLARQSNDEFLKEMLLSNSMNENARPLLQSHSYRNVPSIENDNKIASPSLVSLLTKDPVNTVNVLPEIPDFSLLQPEKNILPYNAEKNTVPTNMTKVHYPKSKKRNKHISCTLCQYIARDKWALKTHMLTHTKQKPYACSLCSYRASQLAHVKKHFKTHVNFETNGWLPLRGSRAHDGPEILELEYEKPWNGVIFEETGFVN